MRRDEDGAANATINRELAALKKALNLAVADGKAATVPKVEMLSEDNVRQGVLAPPDFDRLREALPVDLRNPITFLYYSGWRVGELRGLRWSDVQEREGLIRLPVELSKNGEVRVLALAGELAQVIERARVDRLQHLDCPFVFQRGGKQIGLFRKSWASALQEDRTPDAARSRPAQVGDYQLRQRRDERVGCDEHQRP